MLKLVRELCGLTGVSSGEDEVRAFLRSRAEPYADDIRTDALGNLMVFKRGARPAGTRLMVTAHMDEVGMIVSSVTEEGYLRVQPVGRLDRRVCIGKRVKVGRAGVPGVLALKAFHLVSDSQAKTVPGFDELYVDLGAESRQTALEQVALGDLVAFDSDPAELGDGFWKARALGGRAGCAVMLELLARPLPMDCAFAFTAQAEVGARGAFGAAFSLHPEIGLVLDGAAADGVCCRAGEGPALSLADDAGVYDRPLFGLLRDAAQRAGIPWQLRQGPFGATQAGAVQSARGGVRVCGISLPVRYPRTPAEVCAISDLEHMLTLTRAFLERWAEEEKG